MPRGVVKSDFCRTSRQSPKLEEQEELSVPSTSRGENLRHLPSVSPTNKQMLMDILPENKLTWNECLLSRRLPQKALKEDPLIVN